MAAAATRWLKQYGSRWPGAKTPASSTTSRSEVDTRAGYHPVTEAKTSPKIMHAVASTRKRTAVRLLPDRVYAPALLHQNTSRFSPLVHSKAHHGRRRYASDC
eukprot:7379822-Prymnesium_polylepis.1